MIDYIAENLDSCRFTGVDYCFGRAKRGNTEIDFALDNGF
jgi:hypothetical protein